MEEDRDIPGLVDEIQKYWDHRNTITDQKSKRDKKKLEKLTKKVKPYDGQPEWIKGRVEHFAISKTLISKLRRIQ